MKRLVLVLVCTVLAISTTFADDAKKKKGKETVTFFVEEMECNNCVMKVEKNISFEKGVTDLKCDLPTRTAEVTYRTDKTDTEKLAAAFKKIGMEAVEVKEDGAPEAKKSDHGHDH